MKPNEFYNELNHLTELGYLEKTQLERIQSEYIKDRKANRNIFLTFALLGVIFIGAGMISMFAYNWSMFPKEVKAVIAFLPLLGVQGLLYWKVHTNASEIWSKALTLALGIAFLSALGLIYQAYQISYSIQAMLLTGFLVMLPVIYLLDGYYLAILYMAGICWVGADSYVSLLVLLLFPYYKRRIGSGESCWQLSLCYFIWSLYFAKEQGSYFSYYICGLVLLIYITIEKPELYQRLARRLLYILLFMKAVFYSNAGGEIQDFIFQNGDQLRYSISVPEILLVLLLFGTAVRVYFVYKRKTKDERIDLLLSGSMAVLLMLDMLVFRESHFEIYKICVNFYLIVFSMYRLSYSMKLGKLASVRRYTAAIILYIVLKVTLGNYQLLIKGIVFIIAGLAFLVVNYRMSLKLKGGNTHEDTSE